MLEATPKLSVAGLLVGPISGHDDAVFVTTQLRRLLARSGLVDTRTWASDIRTSSVDFRDTIS